MPGEFSADRCRFVTKWHLETSPSLAAAETHEVAPPNSKFYLRTAVEGAIPVVSLTNHFRTEIVPLHRNPSMIIDLIPDIDNPLSVRKENFQDDQDTRWITLRSVSHEEFNSIGLPNHFSSDASKVKILLTKSFSPEELLRHSNADRIQRGSLNFLTKTLLTS